MAGRIRRTIIQLHNFTGSLLSLVLLSWFISGIVMIFHGFPHAPRESNFLRLDTFKPVHFKDLQAPPEDFEGRVILELCEDRAVYRLYGKGRAQQLIDASSLLPLPPFTESYARKLCNACGKGLVSGIQVLEKTDSWIPWSSYNKLLPFYKCSMDDPGRTVLYVSAVSGEIIQETNRTKRWAARFGAIPHWIYFKKLRLNVEAWSAVIIVLALLGLVVSISGLYMGLAFAGKRKGRLSPYKKRWYRWHHLTGFFFGIFLFTFLISGFFSMVSVPDWMAGVRKKEKIAIRWNQSLDMKGHAGLTPAAIFNGLEQKEGIRRIEWKTMRGRPSYRVYYDRYREAVIYTREGEQIIKAPPLSTDDVKTYGKSLFGELPFSIEVMQNYDRYYTGSASRYRPLPIYRVSVEDAAASCLYIDPATGEEIRRTNRNSRISRWLYRALHTLDFPALKRAEPLRKALLIFLSLGGIALSVTGLVLSFKWFRRKTKRK